MHTRLLLAAFIIAWIVHPSCAAAKSDKLVAGPPALRHQETRPVPAELPILMYHHIQDLSKNMTPMSVGLSTTPASFDAQLAVIEKAGYETVTFANIASGSGHTKKPLILTFDDGYEDAYSHAFPVLRQHHMKGVFYIITDMVGTSGYLTWQQAKEMQDAGMEIGAHSEHHPDLTKITATKMQLEIHGSIQTLAQRMQKPVLSFAYPSGRYNLAVLKEFKTEPGVLFAVTTHSAIATTSSPRLELPRIRMKTGVPIARVLKRFSHTLTHHSIHSI